MKKATSSARPAGKMHAADLMGLSLSPLYRKIEKLSIED
jgi:hypothetical protein